jgi:hypothetical protein
LHSLLNLKRVVSLCSHQSFGTGLALAKKGRPSSIKGAFDITKRNAPFYLKVLAHDKKLLNIKNQFETLRKI